MALPRISRGLLCRGYSAGVPTRLVSDSTVTSRVEAEGHNNWLRTSACCVWEYQASHRRDIPTSFWISHILPLFAYDLALHYIGVCSVHASFPRVCVIRKSLFHFLSHYGFGCGTSPLFSFSMTFAFYISSSLGDRNRQSR